MKRRELQKCVICKRGLAHDGGFLFYRLTVERMAFDPRAVQERAGMEMMFGGGHGAAALAEAMGPDRDLAVSLGAPRTVCVCDTCSTDLHCFAEIAERISNTAAEELRA